MKVKVAPMFSLMAKPVSVFRLGPIAAKILEEQRSGTVIARFERSLYLDLGNGLICLGEARIGDGALSAITRQIASEWALGDSITIDGRGAFVWQPEPWASQKAVSASTCSELLALARSVAPKTGLSRIAFDERAKPSTSEEHAAIPHIIGLRRGETRHLTDLLGLGSGLTPAGDDLVIGWLMAKKALGQTYDASALLEHARHRTHAISYAHIGAATQGFASAALHQMIAELFKPVPRWQRPLDALAEIGHSSGFDALGGVILALETQPVESLF